jgi:hypothetical protein
MVAATHPEPWTPIEGGDDGAEEDKNKETHERIGKRQREETFSVLSTA